MKGDDDFAADDGAFRLSPASIRHPQMGGDGRLQRAVAAVSSTSSTLDDDDDDDASPFRPLVGSSPR